METPIHVFEKAGLGKAPFRCVAVASIPSASLAASNPEAYRNALRELPRDVGCGTCNYCGTAIMHNFIIQSSDYRRFVVGSDCVAKTGDAGLIKAVRGERAKMLKAQRVAARTVKFEERAAARKRQIEAQAEAFKVHNVDLIKAAEGSTNPFVRDVMDRALAGGYVSDRAITAVKSALERDAKDAATLRISEHVGEVGKRQTFKVTVDRVASFERPAFGSLSYETCWIITMRDEAGRAIVSKTANFRAEKGEVLTIKATVKAHDEYKGEKQTVVQRIKVLEAVEA